MTVIAADATLGIMCSDSQWTADGEKGTTRKVWRIGNSLVGFAGDIKAINETRAWLKNPKKPIPRGDVTALIMTGHKLQVWSTADGFHDIEQKFAIGTGGQVARACLKLGASCPQAIAIAKELCDGCGGRTRTYRL